MSNHIKKIENLAKNKAKTYKTFKDINFLLAKFKYHAKNFEKFYSDFIQTHKEIGKQNAINLIRQAEKLTHAQPGTLNRAKRKIDVNVNSQIIHPLFFELDIIMIDARRIAEFFIKFIADLSDEKPPKKIHSFFTSLSNKPSEQNKFIKKLNELDVKYIKFLKKSWDDWISELSDYRSKSIHKSIERMIKCTVTVRWNEGSPIEKPNEIKINNLEFHEKNVINYVNNLWKNLSRFIREGSQFIINNF